MQRGGDIKSDRNVPHELAEEAGEQAFLTAVHDIDQPLTRPFSREINLITVPVVGMQYQEGSGERFHRLEKGDTLILKREPDNLYDSNAIRVCTGRGGMLGYVPRQSNIVLASLMDAGKEICSRVDTKIPDAERPWEALYIDIYMVD